MYKLADSLHKEVIPQKAVLFALRSPGFLKREDIHVLKYPFDSPNINPQKENHPKKDGFLFEERVGGIEPPTPVWKTGVLPLYDTRVCFIDLLYSKLQ